MLVHLFNLLPLLALAQAVAVRRDASFDITAGTPAPILDPAPVAVSIEFFTLPQYLGDLDGRTRTCLANLDGLTGAGTRIRIGGTTQDRATFEPGQTEATKYYVATPKDAPANLTYGPSFFDLAASFSGPTVIGLNRRLANLDNGIAAAKQAVARMSNLQSLELGNEPDLYTASDPIANGSWTPAKDRQSQISWQKSFADALGKDDIIEAGVYLQPPTFSVQDLAPLEQSSGNLPIVKTFADHSYPQSACGGASTNLQQLISHPGIVDYVQAFKPEVEAARAVGKPIVFGETNSATCGGGGISPTFGAALWIIDYVFQSVILGYERLYFHHGTIGNSPYSWWGASNVFAPYYGAYFAADALSHAESIAQLDSSTDDLATYAIRSTEGTVSKLVAINSVYYTNGTRPSQSVTFTNVPSGWAQVKRLTAPTTTSKTEDGDLVTYYGHSFADADCGINGTEHVEWINVENAALTVTLQASEAVLVLL